MDLERWIRLIAGSFILTSLALVPDGRYFKKIGGQGALRERLFGACHAER